MSQGGMTMKRSVRRSLPKQNRREFLIKTGGALAAAAIASPPIMTGAAETVNIGALYPTTGSMAQISVGCVAAAKLAADLYKVAGGINTLGGAKPNTIVSHVQTDNT